MSDRLPIRRALVSVSDKTGLGDLGRALTAAGIETFASGGTHAALADAGEEVIEVAEVTGFPEIMDGRIKTLHPVIHGGILARRDADADAMSRHGIRPIDLVVVNLYPFERAVAGGASVDVAIENIDIGGPTLLRSAAKNHAWVTVVVDPADYPALIEGLGGGTDLAWRRRLALKAFRHTARYDAAISDYFARLADGGQSP